MYVRDDNCSLQWFSVMPSGKLTWFGKVLANEPSGVANIKEGWFQMFSSLALSTLLEHNLWACLKRVRRTAILWASRRCG